MSASAEILLLPALASCAIAAPVSTVLQGAPQEQIISAEWEEAIATAEEDKWGEYKGERYFPIPEKPRMSGLPLPPGTPTPSIKPFKRLSYLARRVLALHLQGAPKGNIDLALDV